MCNHIMVAAQSRANDGISLDQAAAFWRSRLRACGHTGWADPIVYAFDQQERLALLKRQLLKDRRAVRTALDFGCGTGDFSRLLLSMGLRVCGFDPFVEPTIQSPRFSYARAYEEIPCANHDTDVCLTITVLAHLLEEAAVLRALRFIRQCLRRNGVLYMLEYALDSATDDRLYGLTTSSYQTFRTVAEWGCLLKLAGFELVGAAPAPQPQFNPSCGYRAYASSPMVRIRRRYPQLPWDVLGHNRLLRATAAHQLRRFPPNIDPTRPSPLKLVHCVPAN